MEFRDINKQPPAREFLERHVPADRFADFLSRRSPAFKQQPLPSSKRAAIDLMLQQPNLIKRPILVVGARVVFGFDKGEYEKALR